MKKNTLKTFKENSQRESQVPEHFPVLSDILVARED